MFFTFTRDIYDRGTYTPMDLRAELESSQVDASRVDQRTIEAMLSKVKRGSEFVVDLSSIEQGRALEGGQLRPLIPVRPKSRSQK